MPTLALTDFNIVCATLGGFISLFGLVSYLFKEKLYLSEACEFPAIYIYVLFLTYSSFLFEILKSFEPSRVLLYVHIYTGPSNWTLIAIYINFMKTTH